MMKFYTIPDDRFAYRTEVVSSSISTVNAALTAELARPYLKEGAQILDPFCGVGTMLIERHKAVKAGVMYGIDIFGDAIEKARENTERAGCRIFYINKDFFAFEHDYLFDEIITDMPQVTASRTKQEIRQLYRMFFERVGMYLKEEAILVLYATEPQFIAESLRGTQTP
jgi:tRNA G10  N-methylase Trm11